MSFEKMSGLEQQMYFAAREAKHGIVTVEVLESMRLCSRQTLHVVLHNMVRKGWFARVKRGVYAVAQHPFAPAQGVEDAFYAAQLVYPGYLAFSTALYLHKLQDELPFTIFVATNSVSGKRILPGGIEAQAVALGKAAVGAQRINDYIVSTRAKTLFDCLRVPSYAGGYANVLKAFFNAGLNAEEWSEFAAHAQKFASKAFAQRMGYLLSLLEKKTRLKISHGVFSTLRKKKGSKTVFLNGTRCKVVAESKEWRIVDCIGENRLLHWLKGRGEWS